MEMGNQLETQDPEVSWSPYASSHPGKGIPEIKIGLLTGCRDKHYALAVAIGLALEGVGVEVVGSNDIDSPELHTTANLQFLKLRMNRGNQVGLAKKISTILIYYAKLMR